MALNPKRPYLVVAQDFCHEQHNSPEAAVDAAFRAADEGLPCHVLLVVREIDLSEWERCPECGAAVQEGIWCWSDECREARGWKVPLGEPSR